MDQYTIRAEFETGPLNLCKETSVKNKVRMDYLQYLQC